MLCLEIPLYIKICPAPPCRYFVASNITLRGGREKNAEPEMKTRQRIIILLLLLYSWCLEDEPSALSLFTLLSIYCLMTPFTHLHNNNNANDSNNVIMHRHPQRDNMLHTIAMQIMALQSRVRDGLRDCPLFIIHRGFRTQTDRQTHTHTLSSLFGSAVYLVFIRDPVLLCQGPTNPPPAPKLSYSFCLPVGNLAPGWGGLVRRTKPTS